MSLSISDVSFEAQCTTTQWRSQDFSTWGAAKRGRVYREMFLIIIIVSKLHFLHIKCNCRIEVE